MKRCCDEHPKPVGSIIWALSACSFLFGGCSGQKPALTASVNESASLVAGLPANPLQWRIISSSLNPNDSTMATLYGNDVAVDYARSHAEHDYPENSVISLVTWSQQEDERWYGAKIPGAPKSVEFLFVKVGSDGKPSYSYELYEGAPLALRRAQQTLKPTGRVAELLSQRAAVMP